MDVVILHGTYGSPDGNWFPWLKRQMENAGHAVWIPRFPTPENQSVESWCEVLRDAAPVFGGNTILIGHSCGAAYMLTILGVLDAPVARSVFVSGFVGPLGNDEFDIPNRTFAERDFDWEKIKRNMGRATLFYGDNDPYVPRAAAERLGEGLGVPLTIVPNGGHLNAESGYTEFHEILEVLS